MENNKNKKYTDYQRKSLIKKTNVTDATQLLAKAKLIINTIKQKHLGS